MVPGGGLAADRAAWVPSRATCVVPVNARSPLSRALCTEAIPQAGLRAYIAPAVWPLPGNVPSQAKHHGHSAGTSLAPAVFTGASSKRRLVSRTDRTVTCTSRTVGSARPRTTRLDAIELLRRFLQHGLPDGLMTVRHCGLLHASGAIPLATSRLMVVHGQSREGTPMRVVSPPPRVALCPACGVPRRVVLRLWTSPRDVVETSEAP